MVWPQKGAAASVGGYLGHGDKGGGGGPSSIVAELAAEACAGVAAGSDAGACGGIGSNVAAGACACAGGATSKVGIAKRKRNSIQLFPRSFRVLASLKFDRLQTAKSM